MKKLHYLTLSDKWEKFNKYTVLTKYKKKYCGKCGKLLDECCCGAKHYKEEFKSNYIDRNHYTIVENIDNYLVFRTFYQEVSQRVGKQAEYTEKEVMQNWYNEKGKLSKFYRCDVSFVYYYWKWKLETPIEQRKFTDRYNFIFKNILEIKSKPKWARYINIRAVKYTKNIKYGFVSTNDYIERFIENQTLFETLLECKRYDLFGFAMNYYTKDNIIAVKTLLKNNRKIEVDTLLFKDYIVAMSRLNKDLKNINLLLPKDFYKEKARLEKKIAKLDEKERLQENIRKYNESYINRISNLIGIDFGNNEFSIKILPDIQAFFDEGLSMGHCVYRMEYYKDKESFIFSIKKNGKRVETAEIKDNRIKQCYGYADKPSEYHKEILDLLSMQIPKMYQYVKVV